MKKRKCLKEMLNDRADLDLISIGDALEVIEDWLVHIPQRAMYMEPDGNSIMLLSKREALDALYSKNRMQNTEIPELSLDASEGVPESLDAESMRDVASPRGQDSSASKSGKETEVKK